MLGVGLGVIGFWWWWQKDNGLARSLSAKNLLNQKKIKQFSETFPRAKQFDDNKTRIALRLASEPILSEFSQENKVTRLQLMSYQRGILNEKSKMIWRAPKGRNVYGMDANPSENKVLIDWGDAQYEVLSIGHKGVVKLLDLPSWPSADRIETGKKLAFTWSWLDDDRLLGETGIGKPLSERVVTEETAALAELDNIKQTLLYLFDTKTKKLTKIETDNSGLPPVFEIEEVRENLIKVSYHYSPQEEKTLWTRLLTMDAN